MWFRCGNLLIFEHMDLFGNFMIDRQFVFRPLKLNYNMYPSLGPLFVPFVYEKSGKFTEKRQSRWERQFLYWYLLCFVTLPTEQYLDSQDLCLLLIYVISLFSCSVYESVASRLCASVLNLNLIATPPHPTLSEKLGPLGYIHIFVYQHTYVCIYNYNIYIYIYTICIELVSPLNVSF